jgi:two-component system sensor kinase FixL
MSRLNGPQARPAVLSAEWRARRGEPSYSPPIFNPIITMNSGGIIQSASDSVEQVFGWTPTELFGRNVKVLIPEPRRSALDRYLDRYRHADLAKTLKRTRCFDAVRKDGTIFQIELSMSRADLPAQAAPFFIGIVRDVTQEIDVGTDSAGERLRLQHLITEQTRALATANLRLHLADRLASLGTLAAGLGHDTNNVLLPVRA